MIVVGIDPGLQGGVAVLVKAAGGRTREFGWRYAAVHRFPWVGKGKDAVPDAGEVLRLLAPGVRPGDPGWPEVVAVEVTELQKPDLNIPGKPFVVARMVRNIWRLVGYLEGSGCRVVTVRPRDWQRKIIGAVEGDDSAERRENTKAAVAAWVTKTYPTADVRPGRCKNPQDGLTDALGVAHWVAVHAKL